MTIIKGIPKMCIQIHTIGNLNIVPSDISHNNISLHNYPCLVLIIDNKSQRQVEISYTLIKY